MKKKANRNISGLLYLTVLMIWLTLIALASGTFSACITKAPNTVTLICTLVFLVWLIFMWLIGIWHLMNVFFSYIASRGHKIQSFVGYPLDLEQPAVAILYTTCNDFDTTAFATCLRQSYDNYEVLVCDDGNESEKIDKEIKEVLKKAGHHPQVTIVRRSNRRGFKAGNMNNTLKIHGDRFKYFAVADADEILPENFLSQCISRMCQDPNICFAQCAHAARICGATEFAAKHSIAIAGHWRHFVPARQHFGLMPFYGHGAVIRMEAWRRVGGFPEIVSEDIALTVLFYREGYRGIYIPQVICEESFPSDFQAMSCRTGKWVRGTLQFLKVYWRALIGTSSMSVVEKIDIIFCTLGLLLPLPFILVMLLVAVLYLTNQHELLNSVLADLWKSPIILSTSLLAMFSPMIYTLAEVPRHHLRVLKQLVFSAGTYLALVPQSAWEALCYLLSGRASFPVTGSNEREDRKSFGVKGAILSILACILLTAAVLGADLLLAGVGMAFVLGAMCPRRGTVPHIVWCIPFVVILVGLVSIPLSLLAIPLGVCASFAAHQ
jgi:cellulose synthase/poly-beta-1,6-N-acetylglucosamine synthase-like glycosyltransferase